MNELGRVAAIAMLALVPMLAWSQQLEIIALNYRTAEQVLPVLKPLLEPGGTLSGMQNQLFVRTSPKNLAELKQVLAGIDTLQRRLMISVRQDSAGAVERHGAGVTGTVGGGSVVISNEPGGAANERGATARVFSTRSASDDRLVQQIHALEGSPAFIQMGQSLPIVNRSVTPTPRGAVVSESLAYRDVTSGFEVVPRLAGERVVLDISPRRETPGPAGSVDVRSMASSVSGRLGEWIELGGMVQNDSRQRSGLLAGSSNLRQDNRRVWIKVEEIK